MGTIREKRYNLPDLIRVHHGTSIGIEYSTVGRILLCTLLIISAAL